MIKTQSGSFLKPNLFLVGAPKCGTTAIAEYLNQHEQIFLSNPKEPSFWSKDFPALAASENISCLEDYLKLFQAAKSHHRYLLEGSTSSLNSRVAIPQMFDFNPAARFVAIIRNPLEVVRSWHTESLYQLEEDEPDLEKAWSLQGARARGECLPPKNSTPEYLQYGQIASFGEQIERMFRVVPRHLRKVIVFDDLRQSAEAVFANLLDWLELPQISGVDFTPVNTAKQHRFRAVGSLVIRPTSIMRPLVFSVRQHFRRNDYVLVKMLKSWLMKPVHHQPYTPTIRAKLMDFFREDVEKLSSLIDRDLSHWLSDENPFPRQTRSAQGVIESPINS